MSTLLKLLGFTYEFIPLDDVTTVRFALDGSDNLPNCRTNNMAICPTIMVSYNNRAIWEVCLVCHSLYRISQCKSQSLSDLLHDCCMILAGLLHDYIWLPVIEKIVRMISVIFKIWIATDLALQSSASCSAPHYLSYHLKSFLVVCGRKPLTNTGLDRRPSCDCLWAIRYRSFNRYCTGVVDVLNCPAIGILYTHHVVCGTGALLKAFNK